MDIWYSIVMRYTGIGVWRVFHQDAEILMDLNLPIATGSEHSITELTLSDNAQEAPIFRGRP